MQLLLIQLTFHLLGENGKPTRVYNSNDLKTLLVILTTLLNKSLNVWVIVTFQIEKSSDIIYKVISDSVLKIYIHMRRHSDIVLRLSQNSTKISKIYSKILLKESYKSSKIYDLQTKISTSKSKCLRRKHWCALSIIDALQPKFGGNDCIRTNKIKMEASAASKPTRISGL